MRYHIGMLRVVLDTSVLVAGLRSAKGASNALLVLAANQEIKPLVTTSLFLEYEEVLLRAEHRLATGMSEADVAGFLAALASAAEGVEVHFQWRPQLRDPADEMVLEAAINGRADALVTHNVSDFAAAAIRFGLRVVTPGVLFKELRL